MFLLQPVIDSYDLLLVIIAKGSRKNPKQFPHQEVINFLGCYTQFNKIVDAIIVLNDETMIYRELMSSLIVIQHSLSKEDGMRSFAGIVKAIQYFLRRMDILLVEKSQLLEEKQKWSSEKSSLEKEILDLKKNLSDISELPTTVISNLKEDTTNTFKDNKNMDFLINSPKKGNDNLFFKNNKSNYYDYYA
jgi:hypothetical protein